MDLREVQHSDFGTTGQKLTDKNGLVKFEKDFGKYITESAEKHTVPRELLAVVTANEYVDMMVGEEFAENWNLGGSSLGPAQIHTRLAEKYKLFPHSFEAFRSNNRGMTEQGLQSAYDKMFRQYLNDPMTNIDAAGRLMAIFMNKMSAQLDEQTTGTDPMFARGSMSSSFLREIVGVRTDLGSPTFERFVNEMKSRRLLVAEDVVRLDVGPQLMKAMAAAFNDDVTITTEADVRKNNYEGWKHARNADLLDDIFRLPNAVTFDKATRRPQVGIGPEFGLELFLNLLENDEKFREEFIKAAKEQGGRQNEINVKEEVPAPLPSARVIGPGGKWRPAMLESWELKR